jgi:hypothetical protein
MPAPAYPSRIGLAIAIRITAISVKVDGYPDCAIGARIARPVGYIRATSGPGYPEFECPALEGKSSGQGSEVWPASEVRKTLAPAAIDVPSGSSRLEHQSAGIGCSKSRASNAGPHHHAGAGDRACAGTARQRANSATARSN